MNPSVLVIFLTLGGHWLAGQPMDISIARTAQINQPQALIAWQLVYGNSVIDRGQLALAPEPQPSRLTVHTPAVRARTSLRWEYQLFDRPEGTLIERGERTIELYPDNQLAGLAQRVGKQSVAVWDVRPDMAQFLSSAGVTVDKINAAGLAFCKAPLLIVGPHQLDRDPLAAQALTAVAQRGSQVLVLAQTQPSTLAGLSLVQRPMPTKLAWRADHPLLRNLSPADLASWIEPLSHGQPSLATLEVSPQDPVLEIGWVPPELPEGPGQVLSAVLVSRTVGQGRVICCQLPVGPWLRDPRWQILLVNALDYMQGQPSPTPSRSARVATKPKDSGDATGLAH